MVLVSWCCCRWPSCLSSLAGAGPTCGMMSRGFKDDSHLLDSFFVRLNACPLGVGGCFFVYVAVTMQRCRKQWVRGVSVSVLGLLTQFGECRFGICGWQFPLFWLASHDSVNRICHERYSFGDVHAGALSWKQLLTVLTSGLEWMAWILLPKSEVLAVFRMKHFVLKMGVQYN